MSSESKYKIYKRMADLLTAGIGYTLSCITYALNLYDILSRGGVVESKNIISFILTSLAIWKATTYLKNSDKSLRDLIAEYRGLEKLFKPRVR